MGVRYNFGNNIGPSIRVMAKNSATEIHPYLMPKFQKKFNLKYGNWLKI